jgi:hypothetical protein
MRPSGLLQTNGPLSFRHGSWFVLPDLPGSLCTGAVANENVVEKLGGLGEGDM